MMINFATLVSRVTGFTPPTSDRATASGVAAGGEFEALVQAAGGDLGMPAGGEASRPLRLIVNNDAAAAHTASAVAGGEHAHVTHANSELINFVTGREIILPPPTKEALMTVPAEPAPATVPVPVPAAPQVDKPVEPVAIKAQIVTSVARPADPSTAIIATVSPQAQAEQVEAEIDADPDSVTEDSNEVPAQQASAPTPPRSGLAATIVPVAPPVVASNIRASVNFSRTSSHIAVQPEAANSRPSVAAESLLPTAQMEVAKSATEQVQPATMVEAEAPVLRSAAEPVQLAAPVDTAAPAVRGVAGVQGPSTAEALGSRVIDMGVSGQWIDRLAREIAGVADGSGSSRFTLNPPHLGRLQVEIVQSADAVDVHLFTETDEATQRLNEGRSALHADARVAAINLGQLTVEKSSAAFESGTRDQGQREMAGQMQHQQDERQANGRGTQNDRDGWGNRVRGDQANQNDSDVATRAARRTRANSNVRFA